MQNITVLCVQHPQATFKNTMIIHTQKELCFFTPCYLIVFIETVFLLSKFFFNLSFNLQFFFIRQILNFISFLSIFGKFPLKIYLSIFFHRQNFPKECVSCLREHGPYINVSSIVNQTNAQITQYFKFANDQLVSVLVFSVSFLTTNHTEYASAIKILC